LPLVPFPQYPTISWKSLVTQTDQRVCDISYPKDVFVDLVMSGQSLRKILERSSILRNYCRIGQINMSKYFIIALTLTMLSGCATIKRHREEFVIDCINRGGTVLMLDGRE